MSARIFYFESFRLDPAARDLYAAGKRVDLSRSDFDCLAYLIEHRDRAVGRDELISAVWGRVDVSDTQLSQAMGRIRRALEDSASKQGKIRTLPRFGYRWVADTRCDSVDDTSLLSPALKTVTKQEAEASAAGPAGPAVTCEPASARREIVVARWLPNARFAALVVGPVVVLLIAYLAFQHFMLQRSSATAPASRDGAETMAEYSVAVLPAQVEAAPQWQWLRLGLMSLVADRLRSGGLPTLPGEMVIHLSASGDAGALAAVASLRIQPEVTIVSNHWRVRLRMDSGHAAQTVEATADNALDAARIAADLLLIRLGHRPPPSADNGLALEELMRRVEAASLAGKLNLADILIQQASADLRAQPEVRLATAKNVFRSGKYDAAQGMTRSLLDTRAMRTRPELRGKALNLLGAIAFRKGDLDKAGATFVEAVDALHGQSDRSSLGYAYLGQGAIAATHFQYDKAIALFGQARMELAAAGDVLGVAQLDENIGNMQALQHRPQVAREILDAAQKRFAQIDAQEQRAVTLSNLTQVLMQLLEHERALATSAMFWPPEAHTSNQRLHWSLVWTRAAALADNGRLAEARILLQRISAHADPQQDAEVRATSTALLAQISVEADDMTDAQRLSAAALTLLRREQDPMNYLQMGIVQAHILRRAGKLEQAAAQTSALGQGMPADARRSIYIALAHAEQALAEHDDTRAFAYFASALAGAQALTIPEDLVAVSRPYAMALLKKRRSQQAQSVAGGIAMWADHDFHAAWTQACVLDSLDSGLTAHEAAITTARLANERSLPKPLCSNDGTTSQAVVPLLMTSPR